MHARSSVEAVKKSRRSYLLASIFARHLNPDDSVRMSIEQTSKGGLDHAQPSWVKCARQDFNQSSLPTPFSSCSLLPERPQWSQSRCGVCQVTQQLSRCTNFTRPRARPNVRRASCYKAYHDRPSGRPHRAHEPSCTLRFRLWFLFLHGPTLPPGRKGTPRGTLT